MQANPPSLQGQLIRSVLAVVSLIWLVAAAATWFDARHELDELLDAHLAQAASLLLVQKFGDFDGDDIAALPVGTEQYSRPVMFQVFQSDKLMLKSADAPRQPIAPSGAPAAYTTLTLEGVSWRAYQVKDRTRALEVFVAERLASRREILWAMLRSSLWPLALALPLLTAAVLWMVRRYTAPIRALSRAVVLRQPDALESIVVPGVTRELQPLLLSMNGLFARIATLLDSERRFTADAAHELRTPIAAIRMQAQVAAGATEPDARLHALEATIHGCDRATRLVEQLLTLSRLEANGIADQRCIDLTQLARQVVAELAFKSTAKQQELSFYAEQKCLVQGNEMLLTVLFRNLIDNAVRYSPVGAIVAVQLRCQNDRFDLTIEDSGPGMPPADLLRLGERFFRVPGSGASGSGLGWSISRRVAISHRFELRAEASARLGGLAVMVSGPLLKQPI